MKIPTFKKSLFLTISFHYIDDFTLNSDRIVIESKIFEGLAFDGLEWPLLVSLAFFGRLWPLINFPRLLRPRFIESI